MIPQIRTVHPDEFDVFMRFMERAYGQSRDFFRRFYAHIYRPTPEACANNYVIAEKGQIISHVGLFPIHVASAGVRLTMGGIGGVATRRDARGRGHMTRLMRHAIDEMRARGYPASWLGGDRQRYNTFGWEMAAPVCRLTFSRRSLDWCDVEPVTVKEVRPREALPLIAAHHTERACHTRRPHLGEQLRRPDLRTWIADDGYVIAKGQAHDHIKIIELASASGDEGGLLRAVLEWNFAEDVTWQLSIWERERIARVMPYAAGWRMDEHGMVRINNLPALLTAALPWLEQRAPALRDTTITLHLAEHDRDATATLTVRNGAVDVRAGQPTARAINLSPLDAARLIFGGPAPAGVEQLPPGIRALFPLPLYVPPLDRV